ncbi:M20 aminoacylase family protein [Rahnella perminowiae]|uniref:M20 aminoacylase family protein n=1 Tax=Rahnella perminowiae TaxID=2816244 RepID=UPI00215BBCB5|nr:M20 aminoacylase family protein [Rahnella perminowiae]MCR9002709.1 M20 family metallopeptidase [Rahnella perminowiae]
MAVISGQIIEQSKQWRRDFHRRPELGLNEHGTAKIISELLLSFGLDVHTGIAVTGIVATLRNGEGPAIGLRADIDALPIHELNDFTHRSQNPGLMHACGHDGHTSILLGTAKHLSENRHFRGTVHFIFQPAEENIGGGEMMVKEGLFERFPMQAVYALHNWPGLPVGEVAVSQGPMMASQDNFYITLTGKGCHAAMPERGADPVVAGAQLILSLQSLISRRLSPLEQTVISLTQLQAGEAINVIPETLHMSGTLRCLSSHTRETCWRLIEEYVNAVPLPYGVKGEVRWELGYPVTQNHAAQAEIVRDAAKNTPGIEKVHFNNAPSMAAEDFAYLLEACPGAYFWLGADGATPSDSLHSPRYDFNDDIIPLGIGVLTSLVERELKA